MSGHLRFNETKATQAAAYLLRLRGGRMSYKKLIKLLYLADREALLRWGRPITTDRYVSMDRGRVLSHVLALTTEQDDPEAPSVWGATIGEPKNFEVQLKGEADSDEMSDAETQLLGQIFAEYGARSRWELVKLCHDLPEWKNPHGSAIPISYRDILKAGGKSELEIAAVEDELDQLADADLLLAAG